MNLLLAAAVASTLGMYACATPARAQAIDLFSDHLPQSYNNTCQSQAIMLALAIEGHPAFPMANAGELREAELAFRQIVEAIAANDPELSVRHHQTWRLALEQYTSGNFTIRNEYIRDSNVWAQRVAEITRKNISEHTAPMVRLTGVSKTILTSVTHLEGDRYASGHIVAVLGIDPGEIHSSSHRHFLMALNGAIKGEDDDRKSCNASDLPGDYKYSAGVVATKRYDLKPFDGGYALLWLERR